MLLQVIFVPSVAVLPQYFSTRKSLANGIAASGSSVGGIIYPIVFRRLEQSVGFGWATRALGFISLATLGFSALVMKPRIHPKGRRKLVDFSAFQEPPYLLFCFAMLVGFMGFYGRKFSHLCVLTCAYSRIAIFYIQPYALQHNLASENFIFYLLPILNAASVPGRILPNFLADRAGPLNILTPCAIITGILALCWIAIKTLPGVIVFAVLYGFFSGGFVSMPPVAVVSLTPDMRTLGTRMGQCFFFSAFGLLAGTPVTGAILNNGQNWLGVQLFSGITILGTGCLLVLARGAAKGWRLRIKA
jgi:MFS family permease